MATKSMAGWSVTTMEREVAWYLAEFRTLHPEMTADQIVSYFANIFIELVNARFAGKRS